MLRLLLIDFLKTFELNPEILNLILDDIFMIVERFNFTTHSIIVHYNLWPASSNLRYTLINFTIPITIHIIIIFPFPCGQHCEIPLRSTI